MKNTETVMEKLRVYGKRLYDYALSLRDPRNIGLLVFTVLIILVTWSGVKAVQTNYTLQRQIYELQKTNDVKRLENANIELTNEYYKTSQYLEVTARQNLGLAAAGETVLLVPKDVAMAHTVSMPAEKTAGTSNESLPFWQRNFRAWMDFFLNRRSSEV
jgi:cell division protein FtsB